MERIAVFDFDGTIIHGDSVVSLLLAGRKQSKLSLFGLVKAAAAGILYQAHLISAIRSKRAAHAFLKKLSAGEREEFLRGFAQTLVDRARPDALRQIQKHKDNGERVILCSASGYCYMQYVAQLLHVDALLCTPCDAFGLPEGTNCRGAEKVRRVTAYLKQQQFENAQLTAGYGDTAGDAPILRQCQTPVLVHPRKKLIQLMPEAQIVHWQDIKKR